MCYSVCRVCKYIWISGKPYYCYFKFVASKDKFQFQMAFFGMHAALQEFANMLVVAVGDLHHFLISATDCCREH